MSSTGLGLYVAIGLVAGLVAAIREYQDGASPEDLGSAGAVGLFVAAFWPIVGAVVLLGMVAFGIVRLIRWRP